MTERWEISAEMARNITDESPTQKLIEAKKKIMREIEVYAKRGNTDMAILMEYYDVSCPEDWSNIYNWLLNLGYEVKDNSGKLNPALYVKW